jgi:HK97 family phage prohead protease
MLKSVPAKFKAAGDGPTDDGLLPGQFRAVVSVFGNKDSYGDVIVPGAFSDTLAEWKASGDMIPVYWSHQMSDPLMNIGWVVDAQETKKGLEVLAQLDLEDDGSPQAKYAYKLLKGRRVQQFSFAYDVLDGGAGHQGRPGLL